MEIKDKQAFEKSLRKKIRKFTWEFPFYFYMNMVLNFVIISLFAAIIYFEVMTLRFTHGFIEPFSFIAAFVVLTAIFKVTFKSFLRNSKIFINIALGGYVFGIERHEMDNAIEFIEDLPMKKDDLEQLKISLSFGKLIEVMEAAKILSYDEEDGYHLDYVFRSEAQEAFGEKIEEMDFFKKNSKGGFGWRWLFWD